MVLKVFEWIIFGWQAHKIAKEQKNDTDSGQVIAFQMQSLQKMCWSYIDYNGVLGWVRKRVKQLFGKFFQKFPKNSIKNSCPILISIAMIPGLRPSATESRQIF